MLKRKHIQEVIIMDSKKVIRDESLLEVAGGKWTYETLTEEEKQEFNKVSQALTDEWDYIGYNDFIRRMNAKYGE
jgi:hypothetical protein